MSVVEQARVEAMGSSRAVVITGGLIGLSALRKLPCAHLSGAHLTISFPILLKMMQIGCLACFECLVEDS